MGVWDTKTEPITPQLAILAPPYLWLYGGLVLFDVHIRLLLGFFLQKLLVHGNASSVKSAWKSAFKREREGERDIYKPPGIILGLTLGVFIKQQAACKLKRLFDP